MNLEIDGIMSKEKEEEKKITLEEENSDFLTEELLETIKFNNCEIGITSTRILQYIVKKSKDKKKYITKIEIVLDGGLQLDKKTYDIKTNNRELFCFWFNKHYYSTMSMSNILNLLEPYMYKGNVGRDIIKRVFNVLGKYIKIVKPEYILGFNNGWKLPHLEEPNNYKIILYTDYERDAYNRAKNMIKNYSNKEKEKIIKKFERFVEITQNRKNTIVLLSWSLSAPFKLAILEYCDTFPHLFNVGKRLSGKNALEKAFITKFYRIYDKMLSPNTLESISRLEDHLTESTFPHVITEIHKVKNFNTVPILKDLATGVSDFERKKNAFEIAFRKPKVAGLSMDSNNPIEVFKDPAMNTKIIVNEFESQIEIDPEWIKLNREFKKEKLFSFIYEITKEWKNKDVFELLDKQYKKIVEELGLDKVQKLEKENPRLISIYQILLFGLELLKLAFNIEIDEKIETIFNPIKLGRQFIPMELKDQLFHFCKKALKYDTGYDDNYGNWHRGNNPKFLTCPLEMDKNNINYCFTQDNLRDFNDYAKKNYRLKELNNLVMDALENKEDIEYVNKRVQGIRTRYIQIRRDLF